MIADSPTPTEIREELDAVFSRTEFQAGEDDWFWRHLIAFFDWLGGLYDNQPVLFWLILLGCLLLLSLLLFHIGWTVRKVFIAAREGSPEVVAQRERERRSRLFAEQADEHAQVGDFTEAIRSLFLSLVYRFDETGRAHFDQSYTNHEYAEMLGDSPKVRPAVDVFVASLDEHWYGQRPASQADYRVCRDAYEDVTS